MQPSLRLLAAFVAWLVIGSVVHLLGTWDWLWWSYGALLITIGWLDALWVRQPPALHLERQLAGVWPVDVWNETTLTLHNTAQRPAVLDVVDDYPEHWGMQGLPVRTRIAAGGFVHIRYQLRPHARGNAHFGPVYARLQSPLGLWQCTHRIGTPHSVKVFPDFSKLLGHTLTATDRRVRNSGLIRKRQRGEGTDFRQLREYRYGDSPRAIDWKATARQQKPIVREYQEERDQQIIFLLDTGRHMLAQEADGAHFDHALHAVITLAFVAQKQGDAVGLLSFGGTQRWLAPHKGRIGLDRLLSGVYDLQASETAPDYLLAANDLLTRLSKRALVLLITNVRDEDGHDIQQACRLLGQHHLVICASLREHAVEQASQAPVQQLHDAIRSSASQLYLQQRQNAIQQLGLRAGQWIDVLPKQLPLALVNRYLDIKESGRL